MENQDEEKIDVLVAFKPYEHFCKCMLDAFVILNNDGKVVKNSPIFTQVVSKKTKQILKAENLSELIHFEIDKRPLPVSELLGHTSPMRFDEVKGMTETNKNMNLILGIYPLTKAGTNTPVGAFLLIRDVTAETALQDKYKIKSAQSITDGLTGLYNRFYFEQYLQDAVRSYKDKLFDDQSLSLIMADVDHFKRINDGFGHPGGDYVLEGLARIFKKNLRKTDVICRYGGEEFLVILPSTDIEEACIAAQKIREAVQNEHFNFHGQKIPVTISLGVSQITLPNETATQALARADEALYHSKEKGRNRVSLSSESGEIKNFVSKIIV